jgi:hypothetical protein
MSASHLPEMCEIVADGMPWAQIQHAPMVMAGAQMFTNVDGHQWPVTGDEELLFPQKRCVNVVMKLISIRRPIMASSAA